MSDDREVISTQAEWNAVAGHFQASSDYREFSRRFRLNPEREIIMTGRPLEEILTKQRGKRSEIFRTCFGYRRTVQQVNDSASKFDGAECDADLFIALKKDYIHFAD